MVAPQKQKQQRRKLQRGKIILHTVRISSSVSRHFQGAKSFVLVSDQPR